MRRLNFLLVVASLGCSNTPTPPEQPVEKPLRCNTSEPQQCDLEGMKFENSIGRPRSKNEAARHYAASCDAGHGPGCTHLAGLFFEKGEEERAHALYRKSCESGDAEGCANLGFMESKAGNGKRAIELYSQACDDGSMAACANLADIHQSGRGGIVDHDRAQELFTRACAGGNASACIRWAWSLAQGCKGDACKTPAADEKAAALLCQSSCAQTSDPVVCTGYGVHLESGRLLKRDGKAARQLYATACEAGERWACERLGTALARGLGGGAKDGAGALVAYSKACKADFAAGCSGLGTLLLAGEGLERQPERGAQLVGRACELHEARACNTLLLLNL